MKRSIKSNSLKSFSFGHIWPVGIAHPTIMQNNFELLLNKVINFSIEKNMINSIDIKGMALSEISCLENIFNVLLPVFYKNVLSVCGNDGGNLVSESVIYYAPHLLYLREELQEMIEEDIYDPIPANALFFASDRGVRYWYFICDDNPDPLVWMIEEKSKQHLPFVKLSDFIISALKQSVQNFIIYMER
jgi:hypothetical protein